MFSDTNAHCLTWARCYRLAVVLSADESLLAVAYPAAVFVYTVADIVTTGGGATAAAVEVVSGPFDGVHSLQFSPTAGDQRLLTSLVGGSVVVAAPQNDGAWVLLAEEERGCTTPVCWTPDAHRIAYVRVACAWPGSACLRVLCVWRALQAPGMRETAAYRAAHAWSRFGDNSGDGDGCVRFFAINDADSSLLVDEALPTHTAPAIGGDSEDDDDDDGSDDGPLPQAVASVHCGASSHAHWVAIAFRASGVTSVVVVDDYTDADAARTELEEDNEEEGLGFVAEEEGDEEDDDEEGDDEVKRADMAVLPLPQW